MRCVFWLVSRKSQTCSQTSLIFNLKLGYVPRRKLWVFVMNGIQLWIQIYTCVLFWFLTEGYMSQFGRLFSEPIESQVDSRDKSPLTPVSEVFSRQLVFRFYYCCHIYPVRSKAAGTLLHQSVSLMFLVISLSYPILISYPMLWSNVSQTTSASGLSEWLRRNVNLHSM